MIRHTVMFKFLPEAGGRSALENAAETKKRLEALQGRIPTLVRSEVFLRGAGALENCDLMLVAEYNDWEGLHEYIVHPLHKAIGEFMRPLRESRACFDYEY